MIHHTCGRATSVRDNNSQSEIYLLRACYLNLHILFIAFQKSKHTALLFYKQFHSETTSSVWKFLKKTNDDGSI